MPFGAAWEQVGTIDAALATVNQNAAKALQKNPRGNTSPRVEFYLSGDPDSRWVQTESEHARFGVAFYLLDDGSRVLVASEPASVTPLRTRKPELRHLDAPQVTGLILRQGD